MQKSFYFDIIKFIVTDTFQFVYKNQHTRHLNVTGWAVILLMSEDSLSGEPISNYAPPANDDSFAQLQGYNFEEIEDYKTNQDQLSHNVSSFRASTFNSIPKRGRPSLQKQMMKFNQNKPQKPQPSYDYEQGIDLSNDSYEDQKDRFKDHFFDDGMDGMSQGLTAKSKITQEVSKTKPKKKQTNQQQLSDYEDESDEEVSQYHNSLFGQIQSQNDVKSSRQYPKQKFGASHDIDNQSEDLKHSELTNDMIAKRSVQKRQLFNKYKYEKKQKVNDNSAPLYDDHDRPVAISKREKVENKKRFSKKQLELVSRKFQEYYAYETNKQYKGERITLRQIGQMFELGHATIHKLYAEWMDDPYFYQRIKRYDRYRKQTKNPQRKLTLDRLDHISRLIRQNPFLTQHELCVQLNKIEDLKVIKCGVKQNMTRTIVGKLLRMGKYRKKRVKCIPKEKNTSKSLEKRFEYCVKYKEILERRAKVYFLDQSGFNLYMTRDKAWSRPNEEITVNCPISKGKRFSLIAIIGDDGLAHWRFIQGNYRKFEYLDFIRELFQKLVEYKSPEDPDQRWIVMDNCAIHDKEQTINLAKQHGINVLYMPSYSPQLNPIENWFHEIKCKLKKINYSGQKQLFDIMQRILKEYQVYDFTNYYHGSLKFVEKGLKKEKF